MGKDIKSRAAYLGAKAAGVKRMCWKEFPNLSDLVKYVNESQIRKENIQTIFKENTIYIIIYWEGI